MQTYDFNTGNQGGIAAAGTLIAYVSGSAAGNDEGIIVRPERGGSAVELMPGQQFTFPERFQQLRIAPRKSAATVAGKLLIGEGAFTDNRAQGEVAITDAVRATCQLYSGGATAIGFTATQMIAAATNVAGIVIRSTLIESIPGAGGSANVRLIAAPTAPASILPAGPAVILAAVNNAAAGTLAQEAQNDMRRTIPPSWGVWACTSIVTAAATSAGAVMSAEILQ